MALFKAKDASAGASQGLRFLRWCLSAANLETHVEITTTRPDRADRCQGRGISGRQEDVEGMAADGQSNAEQEAPHQQQQQQQLLLWPFQNKIKQPQPQVLKMLS